MHLHAWLCMNGILCVTARNGRKDWSLVEGAINVLTFDWFSDEELKSTSLHFTLIKHELSI